MDADSFLKSREDDPESAKILWHVLHSFDERIKDLERDVSDIRKSLHDITVSIKVVQSDLLAQHAQLDSKLREQFLAHEAREASAYLRAIMYGVGIIVAAFGGLLWFFLQKVQLVS